MYFGDMDHQTFYEMFIKKNGCIMGDQPNTWIIMEKCGM